MEYFNANEVVGDVTKWGNDWFGIIRISLFIPTGESWSIWQLKFWRFTIGGSLPRRNFEISPSILEYVRLVHDNDKNLECAPIKSFLSRHSSDKELLRRVGALNQFIDRGQELIET